MLEIKKAEYIEEFKVRVFFDNGESGVVDLAEALWGPVFEPLKDISLFKKFVVSETLHTISWENGADFAPEYLYEKMLAQVV